MAPDSRVNDQIYSEINKAIGDRDVQKIYSAILNSFDEIESMGVLPSIYTLLQEAKQQEQEYSPEALECLAYCKLEKSANDLSDLDLEIPDSFDFTFWRERSGRNSAATVAGYAAISNENKFPSERNESNTANAKDYFIDRFWVVKLFVTNLNQNKELVDKWWPIVVPALLNKLDLSDIRHRAEAIPMVNELQAKHAQRLSQSGLIHVFEAAIEPAIHYLSPLVSPSDTMLIHQKAVLCLGSLAGNSLERLNFLMIEGCLRPFLHTQEHVELTIYFLKTLKEFIERYLQSLVVNHLHAIVKVFNEIMCNPFIDMSPNLIENTCDMMTATIKWSWPRVPQYKYTILLGLVKANALSTECCRLLSPTEGELRALEQIKSKEATL